MDHPAVGGAADVAAARPATVRGSFVVSRWARVLAVLAPLIAAVLGAAMAVQWEVGGGRAASSLPAPARWMAENLPLRDGGEPVWIWRGPFFVAVLFTVPLAWAVTQRAASASPRWLVRGGLIVAAVAIGIEYNFPGGYGWIYDLAALLAALVGTVWCGVQALRRDLLPRGAAWALIAALPLTVPAGFLTFWYLPPGLTMGTLLAWAIAAVTIGRGRPQPLEETSTMRR